MWEIYRGTVLDRRLRWLGSATIEPVGRKAWETSREEPGGRGTVGSTSHTLAKRAFGGTWEPGGTRVVGGNKDQVRLVHRRPALRASQLSRWLHWSTGNEYTAQLKKFLTEASFLVPQKPPLAHLVNCHHRG